MNTYLDSLSGKKIASLGSTIIPLCMYVIVFMYVCTWGGGGLGWGGLFGFLV